MTAADSQDSARRELQSRVNRALEELPEMYSASRYSEFIDPNDRLLQRLTALATEGGEAGMVAALEEFERLDAGGDEDPIALRRALAALVCHHPAAVKAGLRLPGLSESAPWLTWPSRR